ncbi:dynamin family protein [Formosa sp. PL04]|uniref:dynamin family protein n=1 Tax=Formosa sp. PL04 TaxID=3081755 RepID=UPI002980BCB2|nr:dynamin family protein [Formosa sp. PL04]MDW5288582.1 dynamin family protein [Formosa sp. PL04]
MNTNITTELENCIKVAENIEDNGAKIVLESFLQRLQNNEYYLPVVGQFSAGKSQLINKLLGQIILPVKSIETTAYITYIKYGENGAELLYKDGTIEKIELKDLLILDQQESEVRTNSIESIHVTLKHPMLENGLVLLDTPGVNTLINNHISLTESVLDESQYIIYVFGKSVTSEDLKLIEKLKKIGIKFLFVRTKLDDLKLQEETIEQALSTDKNILTKLEGKELVYFPISNHPVIGKKPEWENYFSKLELYISETISKNTQSFYINSLEDRLIIMKETLRFKLNDKKELLETLSHSSIQEIEKKQQSLEYQIRTIEREVLISEKEIASIIPELMSELKHDIKKITQTELLNFESACNLEHINLEKCQEFLKIKFEESFDLAQDLMIESAKQKVNKFTENSAEKFNSCFTELKTALGNENLEIDLDFNLDTYVKKSEENSRKLEVFYQKKSEIEHLLTVKSVELKEIGVNKQKLESTLIEMNEVQLQLNNQKIELNESYEPVYITEGGNAGSVLKTVGDVLDLAALFIPASGFAKAGSALGIKAAAMASKGSKVAKMTSKAGKITNILTKTGLKVGSTVLNGGSKIMTIASKTDKFKDETKIGELVTKGMSKDGHNKVLSGITKTLSMLSFSHWGEKLGDSIDPITMKLDNEHEQQFSQRRRAIDHHLNVVRNRTLEEMNKNGLFESNDARIRKEKELILKSNQELELRLQKEKVKLYSEATVKSKEQAKIVVNEKLESSLSDFEKQILSQSSVLLKDITNDMKIATNQMSMDKLNAVKTALSKTLEGKKNNMDSVKSFEKEYDNLVSAL